MLENAAKSRDIALDASRDISVLYKRARARSGDEEEKIVAAAAATFTCARASIARASRQKRGENREAQEIGEMAGFRVDLMLYGVCHDDEIQFQAIL